MPVQNAPLLSPKFKKALQARQQTVPSDPSVPLTYSAFENYRARMGSGELAYNPQTQFEHDLKDQVFSHPLARAVMGFVGEPALMAAQYLPSPYIKGPNLFNPWQPAVKAEQDMNAAIDTARLNTGAYTRSIDASGPTALDPRMASKPEDIDVSRLAGELPWYWQGLKAGAGATKLLVDATPGVKRNLLLLANELRQGDIFGLPREVAGAIRASGPRIGKALGEIPTNAKSVVERLIAKGWDFNPVESLGTSVRGEAPSDVAGMLTHPAAPNVQVQVLRGGAKSPRDLRTVTTNAEPILDIQHQMTPLNAEQRNWIRKYTSWDSASRNMNTNLARGTASHKDVAMAAGLQSHIDNAAPLAEDVSVFHGAGEHLPQLEIGGVLDHPNFVSTSTSLDQASGFAKPQMVNGRLVQNIIRFDLPKGYKGGAYIDPASKFPGENEFLLGPNQKWQVVDHAVRQGKNGDIHVWIVRPAQ